MKTTLIALIASAAALVLALAKSIAQEAVMTATKSGYVEANGINYYYEIRGEGAPLLLLHSGLGRATDVNNAIQSLLVIYRS